MVNLFLKEEEVKKAISVYNNLNKEERANIRMFEIFAKPDTNEGRYSAKSQGFVLVRIDPKSSLGDNHGHFVLDFCFHVYGNKISYGMGNFIVKNWKYEPVEKRAVQTELDSIISRLEHPDEIDNLYSSNILLGVVESLNIHDSVWGQWDFYKKIGWRRS